VLLIESLYLLAGEVAQAEGLGLDIEGAAACDHDLISVGVNSVVSDRPHAAKNDSGRKERRPLGVSCTQLSKDRDEGIAHQGIDLIYQKDDWFGLRADHLLRASLNASKGPLWRRI